jgi:23S rRNA pseudouridine2605 synthase
MRLNKFIASSTDLSRRKADEAIAAGRVTVNSQTAEQGQAVVSTDTVTLDGHIIVPQASKATVMLHKPVGVVVSRNGQGSRTIYDLLPKELHALNPVGRLDKDSSGLLLLTNDGALAHELTHPSRQKVKVYEVTLDKPLQPLHQQMISDRGLTLEDGLSKFQLERLREGNNAAWRVTIHEGRNRQIRRTFAALGYTVTSLHRTHFGPYRLGTLQIGQHKEL